MHAESPSQPNAPVGGFKPNTSHAAPATANFPPSVATRTVSSSRQSGHEETSQHTAVTVAGVGVGDEDGCTQGKPPLPPPPPSTTFLSADDETFEESDFAQFLSGYVGFGSFFSADVEDLIREPDGDTYNKLMPAFPQFSQLNEALAAAAVFVTPCGEGVKRTLKGNTAAAALNNNNNIDTHNSPHVHHHIGGGEEDDACHALLSEQPDGYGRQSECDDAACVTFASIPASAKGDAPLTPDDEDEPLGDNSTTKIITSFTGQRLVLPSPPAFGRPFRDAFFSISDEFTFINHGAFGGALRFGVHLKHSFENLMESQLLTYMDRLVLPWITHTTRLVANTVLHCRPTDLVLIPNATYGLNAAIAGLINHGDVVVFLETEYLAVYKMIQERCESLLAASVRSNGALAPAALKELPLDGLLLDAPVMGDDAALASHIAKYIPQDTTVLVMDLITSTASLHFPVFTHIIPMLKKTLPNLKHIIVDGAHGPLQYEVNIGAMQPEQLPSVYVGNLHKWFSAPKSVGLMWVREDVQDALRPIVISHGAKNGFLSDFVWDGTRDHGAVLALPTIIDFWYKYIGVDRVRSYCTNLKKDVIALLTKAWGPDCMEVPRGAPFMSLVMLPSFFQRHSRLITAKYIQDVLHHQHRIEVPAKSIRGKLYLRVSFFVNNDMADYERLRDAVLLIQSTIIADLRKAKAQRLTAISARPPRGESSASSCDNASHTSNRPGDKRSRSPAAETAEGGAEAATKNPIHAPLHQNKYLHHHHDKSQIVRHREHDADAALSSASSTSSTSEPSAAGPSPPHSSSSNSNNNNNNGAALPAVANTNTAGVRAALSMSAASSYGQFKPFALDVPLNLVGSTKQIIVQCPAPRTAAAEIVTNVNGVTSNGKSAAPSSLKEAGASLGTPDEQGGAGGQQQSNTNMVMAGGMVLTAAPTNGSGTVDPNCNGCGIGAIGAAPKKTRKF